MRLLLYYHALFRGNLPNYRNRTIFRRRNGADCYRGLAIFHPEDHARAKIDAALAAAGWLVQSRAQMNLGAAFGIAVREFPAGSGPVDYALFVGRDLCGVIEAKPAGTTLSGFAEQAARYIADVPEHLIRRAGQVRFEYVTSDNETLFRDHADPAPRSRRVYTFHRPETLQRLLADEATIRRRLQAMLLITDGLRDCQVDAMQALKASLSGRSESLHATIFLI